MKSLLSFVWEVFKILIISLVIILPIRYFLIQPFFVKGASMEPNFDDGHYLIIDELSYRLREPQRGEVIVFRYPANTKEFFIKRIIGLPGETVELSGKVVTIKNKENVNGFVLDESGYLRRPAIFDEYRITLKEGEFFVMGDNRSSSFDSRRFGPVAEKYLTGRVWLRAWPVNAAGVLKAPVY